MLQTVCTLLQKKLFLIHVYFYINYFIHSSYYSLVLLVFSAKTSTVLIMDLCKKFISFNNGCSVICLSYFKFAEEILRHISHVLNSNAVGTHTHKHTLSIIMLLNVD